ncbi:hypothetical protein BpHYR1_007297 [Brachionus plicatilis]|uniref:Uncharacterized protein n=1 Tax=Brachionus plicatilis TaxID=10195 RepID=A0A3M7P700_BRAPC|nr:hypothetical protein BpHYR1_007297 [Brachionus plicatilis]
MNRIALTHTHSYIHRLNKRKKEKEDRKYERVIERDLVDWNINIIIKNKHIARSLTSIMTAHFFE